MNPEGKLEVIYNNSLIASIANNSASGTDLAFTDGKINVKAAQDDAGNLVFQLKGDSSAAPQNIPADGSQASLSIPLDSSSKSALADGGDTPEPPTVTTVDLDKDESIPTDGSPYNLIGSVESIGIAKTSEINGATNITVRDNVTKLTGEDADSAAVKAVLNLADNIVVQDKLETLALADLSGLTNPKLVVTLAPRDGATVNLKEVVKVAAADGAQGKLDAFLARTDVDYTTFKQTKPTTLTLGTYSIEDDATAIGAAKADLLAKAETVAVNDTMGNIANLSSGIFADIDSFTVKDTLASITGASLDLIKQIGVAGDTPAAADKGTFIATDTTAASAKLSTEFITAFDASAGKTIDLSSLTDKGTLSITLEGKADASTGAVTGVAFDTSTNTPVFANLNSNVAVTITGSEGVDTITLTDFKNGVRIEGNGGRDVITLGAGNDTVVLGSGVDLPTKVAATSTTSANNTLSIKISEFTTGKDKLTFSGELASFTSVVDGKTLSTSAVTDLGAMAGKVAFFSASDTAFTSYTADTATGFKGLEKNESAIVVLSSSSGSKIYYVEERDGKDGITMEAKGAGDIVVEIANVDGKEVAMGDFTFA